MLRYFLIVVALLPVAYLGYCATHIPGGADVDVANEVAHIIATGYGKFDERQIVEQTGKGKIYYVAPGSGLKPTVILYEVTSPGDIALVEKLATQALQQLPQVQAIRLKFYERQNISIGPQGGAVRGWDWAFKNTVINRDEERY